MSNYIDDQKELLKKYDEDVKNDASVEAVIKKKIELNADFVLTLIEDPYLKEMVKLALESAEERGLDRGTDLCRN